MGTINFKQIEPDLLSAKNILILLPANPSLDSVASGLALYLSLKKQEKNIGIGCPTKMTVAFNRLIAIDKITDKIGNRNLVISFDYMKDSIEKVSYNIEDNKFNLVIEPKANCPALNSNKVAYSYSGAFADLIFIVGASKLEDLENLYFDEKSIFNDKQTVNIDYKPNNSRFGRINFHDPQASSCSEITAALIQDLSLPVDPDVATNIFSGLKSNTSNFQSLNMGPSAFETASWCLKNGARKDFFSSPGFMPQTFNQPAFSNPFSQQQINQPMPAATNIFSPPPFVQNQFQPNGGKGSQQPPADWLKPKIYKSNTTI